MRDRVRASQPISAARRRRARLARRVERRRRAQDGLVLLSVLLIVMMGTAIAVVTVRDGTHALSVIRSQRAEMQGRYAAEAALVASLSMFDAIREDLFYQVTFQPWDQARRANPGNLVAPQMLQWGIAEPNIPMWTAHSQPSTTIHHAARFSSVSLENYVSQISATQFQPLSRAGDSNGGPLDDLHGNFGPNSAVIPAPNFVIDFYDCAVVEAGQGQQAGGSGAQGAGGGKSRRRCEVVARHTSALAAIVDAANPATARAPLTCNWDVNTHPNMVNTISQVRMFPSFIAVASYETLPLPE